MWYAGQAASGSGGINSTNNWEVREHPITGSLALNVQGEGDAHAIATQERILDISQDLRFEYSFTPDESGIGARVSALDYDQNGSRNNRITEETPRAPFGAAERGNEFKFLDYQTVLSPNRFSTNEINEMRVEWQDGVVRGYHNDELIAEAEASTDGTNIDSDGDYRLQIQANGAFGGDADFWINGIRIEYI
jgi:hypothetical protein